MKQSIKIKTTKKKNILKSKKSLLYIKLIDSYWITRNRIIVYYNQNVIVKYHNIYAKVEHTLVSSFD